jgi:hypothetical protein
MLLPALKKLLFLSFSVLILVLLSGKMAWADSLVDWEPYFKYGIPAVIVGVIIGCALGRKFPIFFSIAGGIGGNASLWNSRFNNNGRYTKYVCRLYFFVLPFYLQRSSSWFALPLL